MEFPHPTNPSANDDPKRPLFRTREGVILNGIKRVFIPASVVIPIAPTAFVWL